MPKIPINEQLANVRIILKDTTHPGNIGSTARAMKTMGFTDLNLVATRALIDSHARALATGATDILDNVKYYDNLPAAIAECARIFAVSSRSRELSPTPVSIRDAANIAASQMAAGNKIAFIFGSERSGLTNADMLCAGYAVSIPGNPHYRSLNLSQAAQIVVYELRQAVFADYPSPQQTSNMPTHAQIKMLLDHFAEFLSDINMPRRQDGDLLRARLSRLLIRAEPTDSEVRLLRGILTAARKKTAVKK